MIYFIRTRDKGSIKIGQTDNLRLRLNALAYVYSSEIEVLKTVEGDYLAEMNFHRRFRHLRIAKTEQFRPGDDLMHFLDLPAVPDWESVKRSTQITNLSVAIKLRHVEYLDELVIHHRVDNRAKMMRQLIAKAHTAMKISRSRRKSRSAP